MAPGPGHAGPAVGQHGAGRRQRAAHLSGHGHGLRLCGAGPAGTYRGRLRAGCPRGSAPGLWRGLSAQIHRGRPPAPGEHRGQHPRRHHPSAGARRRLYHHRGAQGLRQREYEPPCHAQARRRGGGRGALRGGDGASGRPQPLSPHRAPTPSTPRWRPGCWRRSTRWASAPRASAAKPPVSVWPSNRHPPM